VIDLTARDKAALDAALDALNTQATRCDTAALSRVLAVAAYEVNLLVHGEVPTATGSAPTAG
jgi:hypothetical protein